MGQIAVAYFLRRPTDGHAAGSDKDLEPLE